MKTKIVTICILSLVSIISYTGCIQEEIPGPAGQDATVYYSEWFSPSQWSGVSGDWYFEASAPDLTEDIVENGVVLAYVWLAGDLYEASSVRPLPAYAVGANWSYLIYKYGSVEFTCDMITQPGTDGNKFRFIALPGSIPALKSTSSTSLSLQELKNMSYQEVCKLYNIPE